MPRPRRVYSSPLKSLLLVKHLVGIGAVVAAVNPSKNPPTHPSVTLASSNPSLYYAPRYGFEVTAPALCLGRMEACNPSPAKMAGKIVVTILDLCFAFRTNVANTAV